MKYRRNHRLLDKEDMTFTRYVISLYYKIYIRVNLPPGDNPIAVNNNNNNNNNNTYYYYYYYYYYY